MEIFELVKEWFYSHPTTTSIIKYMTWLTVVIAVIQFLRRFLKRQLPETSSRYKAQKAVEIFGYFKRIFFGIKKQWEQVVNKFYVENAVLDPTLAITLTDNWMKFNLRYIVDYKKRRMTQHLLHDSIYKKIKETHGSVQLVSTTVEVIKIPEIKIEQ